MYDTNKKEHRRNIIRILCLSNRDKSYPFCPSSLSPSFTLSVPNLSPNGQRKVQTRESHDVFRVEGIKRGKGEMRDKKEGSCVSHLDYF